MSGTRYIIIGVGAAGGTIAASLFAQGYAVLAVARGAHGRAIAQRGLMLATPTQTVTYPIPVVERISDVVFRSGDVAIMCMKSQDTPAVLEQLSAFAPPDLHVVCAQNGVENERLALRSFANVHGMCLRLLGVHLEPGVVEVYNTPLRGVFDVGRYPRGVDAVDRELAQALLASGIESLADPEIMRRKYAKLLMNVNNALEAACGSAGRDEAMRARLRAETLAVYAAAGIDYTLPAGDEERNATSRPGIIAGRKHPGNSTWQSLARGAGSTEVDALNGEIVLLGRLYGVATPINAALQRLSHRMLRDGLAAGALSLAEVEREIVALATTDSITAPQE